MMILEPLFSLSVSNFSVPEQVYIQEKIARALECKKNPAARTDCKNALERYHNAKDKTGEVYVYIQ